MKLLIVEAIVIHFVYLYLCVFVYLRRRMSEMKVLIVEAKS